MSGSRIRPVLIVSVALVCVLFAFPAIVAVLARGPLFYYHVLLLLSDVPLAILGVAVLADALIGRERPDRAVLTALGFVAALVVALAFHPSPQGIQLVVRLLAAIALAVAIVRVRGLGAWPLGGRARPRAHAAAIAALLLGAGIPALLTFDAWATQSAKSLDPNSRDILLREGLELYGTSPLVGIGPGRMVVALAEKEAAQPGSVELLQPTHGVPILALVEGGIQAGVLCAAVVLLMAWRARRSWVGLALFGVYLPFILFDHYPYTHAQGIVLSAVWLGAVELRAREAAARVPAAPTDEATAPSGTRAPLLL